MICPCAAHHAVPDELKRYTDIDSIERKYPIAVYSCQLNSQQLYGKNSSVVSYFHNQMVSLYASVHQNTVQHNHNLYPDMIKTIQMPDIFSVLIDGNACGNCHIDTNSKP